MRISFFLMVVLFRLSVSGQNNDVSRITELVNTDRDSAYTLVNQLLQEGTLDDYSKSRAYYLRAYLRQPNDKQTALWDYMEAVRFLDLSNVKDNESRTGLYNNIAQIYKSYSNYDLALKFYDLANEISPESTKKNVLYNIGNALRMKGEYAKAMETYLEALEYCDDDINQQAKIYSMMAVVLYHSENYDQSSDYLYSVLNVSDQIDPIHVARAYHRLGRNYSNAGDTARAIDYFKLSIDVREGKDRFISLQDLAELYMETGQYQEAIATCNLAEKYISELNPDPSVFELYTIKANSYYELGNFEGYKKYMDTFIANNSDYNLRRDLAKAAGERQLIQAYTNKHKEAIAEQKRKEQNLRLILIASVLFVITLYLGFVLYRKYIKKKQVEREIASIQQRYNRLS